MAHTRLTREIAKVKAGGTPQGDIFDELNQCLQIIVTNAGNIKDDREGPILEQCDAIEAAVGRAAKAIRHQVAEVNRISREVTAEIKREGLDVPRGVEPAGKVTGLLSKVPHKYVDGPNCGFIDGRTGKACGEPPDGKHHIRYGPDVENSWMHEFEAESIHDPNCPTCALAIAN